MSIDEFYAVQSQFMDIDALNEIKNEFITNNLMDKSFKVISDQPAQYTIIRTFKNEESLKQWDERMASEVLNSAKLSKMGFKIIRKSKPSS